MATWSSYLQVIAYIALLFFIVPIQINGPTEVETQFQQYLTKFNKSYDDPVVYQDRLEVFRKSLETIALLNSNRSNNSAEYGLTKYSDMSPDEFKRDHLKLSVSQKNIDTDFVRERRAVSNLPQKIDWRKNNTVTKIKSQGQCGACWAFSTVETIESMNAIQNGKLQELSVQEIIDCAGYTNKGCDGGDICTVLLWMKNNKVRIQTEDKYPLNLKHQKCKLASSVVGVQIDDFVCEDFVGNEDIMMDLLARNGPLAVAINAKTWQHYIGGVITFHCDDDPSQLNHAVQIVGYDLTADIPHYIVRNTWSEDFGDKGYLYIAIGKNMCGLANEVSALTVL